MPVLALDPCIGPITFLCDLASNAAGSAAAGASDYVLGGLGAAFVNAAALIGTGALTALDALTPIDLSVAWLRDNVAVIATITLPVLVALFALQVITSVLRREPGGLARAVVGVGKAVLGAALALGVTQVALTAVDELCGYVAASAGTSVAASAGRFFNFAAPVLATSPGLAILFGLAMMVGFVLLWGVLLFRKAALILIAVLAPIAFAGSVWDQTRVWTRRWMEIVAALVFSKLVIVVVFVVGASAFSGVGPDSAPAAEATPSGIAGLSDLLVGLLLLSIAVFAPWLTWRFVHWTGMEAAAVMNSAVAAGPITRGVRSVGAQTRGLAQQAATTMLLGHVGAAGAAGKAATAGKAAGGTATAKPIRPTEASVKPTPARTASAPPRATGGGPS
jgi:hypothetical protein